MYGSTISQHDWSLHRKGAADQERHKAKIREAIKKNLADIVSEESIILSDGKKVFKAPIRSLEEYRFRYDPGRQQHAGEGDGDSQIGDVIAADPRPGKGQRGDAGEEPGVVEDAKSAHPLQQHDGVGHRDFEIWLLQPVTQTGIEQLHFSGFRFCHLALFSVASALPEERN